jgi:antitoxin PrlF
MITSKLTNKARTTIPRSVRMALGVGPGDEIAYEIEGGRVVLTRSMPRNAWRGLPLDDPFATFTEWDSPEDDAAFANI